MVRNICELNVHNVCLYTGDINIFDICAMQSYCKRTNYTKRDICLFAYLCGATYANSIYNSDAYIVYQGHHYETDDNIVFADSMLPSTSFME